VRVEYCPFSGLAACDIKGDTLSQLPEQTPRAGNTDENATDGNLGRGGICNFATDELTSRVLNFNQTGSNFDFAAVASR
jgi:hypothetical protein